MIANVNKLKLLLLFTSQNVKINFINREEYSFSSKRMDRVTKIAIK